MNSVKHAYQTTLSSLAIKFRMETFVSAIVGDLVGRSISFVLDKYYQQKKGLEENLQELQRLLLRIESTVNEAEERHITNHAMLQQLHTLREGVHKGYYMLDAFKYRVLNKERITDEDKEIEELEKMLQKLESMTADMKEFVVFLSCYPPVRNLPNSKYILLENCMFGRQAELERVIKFLLGPDHLGAKSVDVLPVIGPARVGKSTLVEHVCHDEVVRKNFSLIVFYTLTDFGNQNLEVLRETAVIKYKNPSSVEKSLVVIDIAGDLDEKTWKRMLYCLRRDHTAPVSKIIIISRSKKIEVLGTTEALRLTFLPEEAFWYFFKVISFGSTNPHEQPELMSICMEITPMINGSFIGANVVGRLLRANHSVQFWYRIFRCMKGWVRRHLLRFGEYPRETLSKGQPIQLWTIRRSQSVAVIRSCYQACSAQHVVPKITAHDVHNGNVKPQGKFEAVMWSSSIPPYYSYLACCEVHAQSPHMMGKKEEIEPEEEGLV